MSIEDEQFGQAVKEYKAGRRALASKLCYLQKLGGDLVHLGQWLQRYDHGQITKESLADTLNVTEDVTLTMAVSYLPAQELSALVNEANTLTARLHKLKQEIDN